MARLSEHGIRLSSMSPSFLNSNSTSHTWPFSAVAELIDNASDPGVSAKQMWIDVVNESGQLCLTFTDNGSGMTPYKLHKMLSFGFTEKGSGKASLQAIGVYGNGFKSGSMRLGRDALIFTKNGGCQSVGLLSQTYLENIKAQAVIVPIVPFNQQTKSLVVTEDSEASLAAILQHSILTSQEQIHTHFDSILSKKGTKILIWNIRRTKDGNPEIDFESDESDFRLPQIEIEEMRKGLRNSGSLKAEQNILKMQYSLRAYLSILYLKPRTQIVLRGKKILAKLVSKRLTHIEHDVYKPHFSKEKVKVTFGMDLKNKDHYGIMMYHKNRLIKAYEKVGGQLKTSGQRAGVGVVGVIECNFLKPAHNKQDFEYTKEYRLTLGALGLKLNDYWKAMTEKKAREREFQAVDIGDENEKREDADEGPTWIQCEECLKWRSIPASHYNVLPESWRCSENPNPRYRSCTSPEEAEESEELLTPSYQKNHKKQEHPKSRKREKSLEVCSSQDQTDKHRILSRSTSEPSQPTYHSTRTPDLTHTAADCHTEENVELHDQANTDLQVNDDAQTGSKVACEARRDGRETVITDKTLITPGQAHVENDPNAQSLEDDERHKIKDTNTNETAGDRKSTDILSFKRKSGSLFYCVQKKPRMKRQPGDTEEESHPEKQAETASSEKTRQESSSDKTQQTSSSLPWHHSLPSTQTGVVSPLSRTDSQQGRPLPPEGTDREAKLQRLAVLEKEAQRLRGLLDLEMSKRSQSTMTAEKPKERPETPPASAATRAVGCQTDVAEVSTSSTGPTQAPELQGPITVCGSKEQPEQNRTKKEKNETPSRTRVNNSEACEPEDTRSAQEDLRAIRNNVVVLLTALLPQLDLNGISMETADIDNILQQIIEVNSLKL